MSFLVTAPNCREPRAVEAVRLGARHRQSHQSLGEERKHHGVACPDSRARRLRAARGPQQVLRGLEGRAAGDWRASGPVSLLSLQESMLGVASLPWKCCPPGKGPLSTCNRPRGLGQPARSRRRGVAGGRAQVLASLAGGACTAQSPATRPHRN